MQTTELKKIKEEAERKLQSVASLEELEGVQVEFFGKEGRLTILLRSVKKTGNKEQEKARKEAKEVQKFLERAIERRRKELQKMKHTT